MTSEDYIKNYQGGVNLEMLFGSLDGEIAREVNKLMEGFAKQKVEEYQKSCKKSSETVSARLQI